jgi:8-hydroxy-5-deazaflavin:NADPH oxidoreductase
MRVLIAPLPDLTGRRVVFIARDYEDASAEVSQPAERLGFAPIQVGKIAEGGRLIQARAALVFQNLIKYPL